MRKRRFWIILPILFLLIPKGHSAQVKISFKTLDEDMPKALEAWKVPGLALAIVKDGAVVWAKGYGVRDIEKKTPVDERTVFGCGSTTKAFTAALVGILVHEGRIGVGIAVKPVDSGAAGWKDEGINSSLDCAI